MGCKYSYCHRQAPEEAELGIEPSTHVKGAYNKTHQNEKFHDNNFGIPTLNLPTDPSTQKAGLNTNRSQYLRTEPTEEPLKSGKSELSTTMAMTLSERNFQGASLKAPPNLNQTDFRFGKSPKELSTEISQVKDYIIKALNVYQHPKPLIKRTEVMLDKWQEQVYDQVCKRTGEFKTSVVFNTNMSSIKLKHEVSGCSVDQILLYFCKKNSLLFNHDWVHLNLRKLAETASLVFSFGLEINFSIQNSVEFFVFLDSVRHFTNEFLDLALHGNCEEKNINAWCSMHTPLLSDFGFTINTRFQKNEINLSFLIFDGTLRNNLTRAMSVFQLYGAVFNEKQFTILKKLPSEELRVVVHINQTGVSRVIMWINRLTDEVAGEIITNFCEGKMTIEWEAVKSYLLKDDNTFRFFLEFSSGTFQFGYECPVGKDFGSFIYFESLV